MNEFYFDFDVRCVVGGTASTGRRDIADRVVEVSAVRCHLVAQELGRQFPVQNFGAMAAEITINDLATDCIDRDALADGLALIFVGQAKTLGVASEDGSLLLTEPVGGRTRFGDAHAETIEAAILIAFVQKESVWLALVTTLARYQILFSRLTTN